MEHATAISTGRRLAVVSVAVSAALAALNISVGLLASSTSVVATGVEFAGDVLTSAIVFLGLAIASRPPDANHPYGHGRFEILAGLLVGVILLLAGIGISLRSLERVNDLQPLPGPAALGALACAIAGKSSLAAVKFSAGRRIGSAALVADAWNDAVDLISALVALISVALTIQDPDRFRSADHYGGFAVGIIVVLTGLRVARDASMELTDTMPRSMIVEQIREYASGVPGVLGVEKCFARKTGLQYHVDLHIEVNPEMTVAQSHDIAAEVRHHLRRSLPAIADVLVHIEPFEEKGAATS